MYAYISRTCRYVYKAAHTAHTWASCCWLDTGCWSCGSAMEMLLRRLLKRVESAGEKSGFAVAQLSLIKRTDSECMLQHSCSVKHQKPSAAEEEEPLCQNEESCATHQPYWAAPGPRVLCHLQQSIAIGGAMCDAQQDIPYLLYRSLLLSNHQSGHPGAPSRSLCQQHLQNRREVIYTLCSSHSFPPVFVYGLPAFSWFISVFLFQNSWSSGFPAIFTKSPCIYSLTCVGSLC